MHYIVIVIVLLVLVFFAIWIAAVLFARLLAVLTMIAVILAGAGLLAGVIIGMIAPYRVLRGRGRVKPEIASPSAVHDGKVFSGGPKGPSANFGWDPAWPLYVPYQLKFDQIAVSGEANLLCRKVHSTVRGWLPKSGRWYTRLLVNMLGFLLLGIPTWGVIGGIAAGTLIWLALTWLFSQIAKIVQAVALRSMRASEARHMKREGATVRCTRCYNTFDMPSFMCSNRQCNRLHRDISPGRLGIRSRICTCETELPLTVAKASRSLVGFCPYCPDNHALPTGSGNRRVAVVPVFGSIGAGKTRFLASSAVSLYLMEQQGGYGMKFEALNPVAGQFLRTSFSEYQSGSMPVKTQRQERPEGYPYLIDFAAGELELHLMDAAGENFTDVEKSTSLRYLDVADSLVFLLDPLAIPEVADVMRRSPNGAQFQVAQGSSDDSYGSVVERLRNSGVDLRKRSIAVVITKADAVASIMPEDPLPSMSNGVRDWLFRHGEDRLVTRVEMDFVNVDYFAVSSLGGSLPESDHHPVQVIDWAVTSQGGSSLLSTPAQPPRTTQPKQAVQNQQTAEAAP